MEDMKSQSENIFVTFGSKKQISTILSTLATCAIALGMILGTAALLIWPITLLEGWNSDSLITIMLVCAFFLLFAACHYFDCDDERKRRDSRKSL